MGRIFVFADSLVRPWSSPSRSRHPSFPASSFFVFLEFGALSVTHSPGFCFLISPQISDRLRRGWPPSFLSEFRALQFSLMLCAFIGALGGAAFLGSAIFIEGDRRRAQLHVQGQSGLPLSVCGSLTIPLLCLRPSAQSWVPGTSWPACLLLQLWVCLFPQLGLSCVHSSHGHAAPGSPHWLSPSWLCVACPSSLALSPPRQVCCMRQNPQMTVLWCPNEAAPPGSPCPVCLSDGPRPRLLTCTPTTAGPGPTPGGPGPNTWPGLASRRDRGSCSNSHTLHGQPGWGAGRPRVGIPLRWSQP